jgi:hypothetical protein
VCPSPRSTSGAPATWVPVRIASVVTCGTTPPTCGRGWTVRRPERWPTSTG